MLSHTAKSRRAACCSQDDASAPGRRRRRSLLLPTVRASNTNERVPGRSAFSAVRRTADGFSASSAWTSRVCPALLRSPWSGCPAGSSRARPDFNGSQPLATRLKAPCPFRPCRAILVRQIYGPQGVGSHSVRPVRTQNRNTLSDFIRLLTATVHALRPDDLQNGGGN